jgi:hypothetical protein
VALMAVKAHRIVIEPTSIRGERGQYYRVYFEGAVVIEDTWNPEFEACRALVARGVTGRLETWRADKPYPGLIFPDIAEGARWTVVENPKEGPLAHVPSPLRSLRPSRCGVECRPCAGSRKTGGSLGWMLDYQIRVSPTAVTQRSFRFRRSSRPKMS